MQACANSPDEEQKCFSWRQSTEAFNDRTDTVVGENQQGRYLLVLNAPDEVEERRVETGDNGKRSRQQYICLSRLK
jgi:hypothetical protein